LLQIVIIVIDGHNEKRRWTNVAFVLIIHVYDNNWRQRK